MTRLMNSEFIFWLLWKLLHPYHLYWAAFFVNIPEDIKLYWKFPFKYDKGKTYDKVVLAKDHSQGLIAKLAILPF